MASTALACACGLRLDSSRLSLSSPLGRRTSTAVSMLPTRTSRTRCFVARSMATQNSRVQETKQDLQQESTGQACTNELSSVEMSKRAAVAMLAAAALLLAPMAGNVAEAAQGGGRVGGQNFSSRRAAPPPPSRTTVRSSTNVVVAPSVVVAPTVAPPVFGGWGWGWSPYTYATPGVTVVAGGGGLGFLFDFFIIATVVSVVFGVIGGLFRRNDDRF